MPSSLGPESPRDFDPGIYRQAELKLNFDVSYAVSVRGGVSTGFRAPTPGQQNVFNVQSTINPETLDRTLSSFRFFINDFSSRVGPVVGVGSRPTM